MKLVRFLALMRSDLVEKSRRNPVKISNIAHVQVKTSNVAYVPVRTSNIVYVQVGAEYIGKARSINSTSTPPSQRKLFLKRGSSKAGP